MATGKKVQILLSTYNGQKYLKEQLDSYLTQQGDFSLSVLIRDDGSQDDTLNILEEYRQKYGFKVVCGDNLGVNKSYFALFELADDDCDYYAISDQDDVWLSNKISDAVEALNAEDSEKPLVYATCLCVTDENLNIKKVTPKLKREVTFFNEMVQNMCSGHTMVFNTAALKIIRGTYSENLYYYDYWLALIASAFGKIIYSQNVGVYYRQHGTNLVGKKYNAFTETTQRIRRVKIGVCDKNSVQLQTFVETFKAKLSPEIIEETDKYFNCQKSFFGRIRYVFKAKAFRQSRWETFIFKSLFILGKYKV